MGKLPWEACSPRPHQFSYVFKDNLPIGGTAHSGWIPSTLIACKKMSYKNGIFSTEVPSLQVTPIFSKLIKESPNNQKLNKNKQAKIKLNYSKLMCQ